MSSTPPKKEGVEQTVQSPDDSEPHMDREAQETQAQGLGYEFEVKEQDRWLPIANVARIMKMALPENAKIAKEAKECMQECVSEFISFITSEASEKCQQEKRKTVNGEDILFAMTSLGFENYSEALKIYLSRYRETLLANQNTKPPANQYNASGANAGANPAAENAQHPVLSGDTEMGDNDNTAFGYTVHNANGAAEF
ncbi:histone-fold-containing protein [Lentithecium fluviatile CBS 122367]|uniref:Histone-fold-containing protein n=1 Tax=Lentithecium fluviatile CBS 122367 TaxID=1168545 RepID=A0A6G1IXS5_9PLEO|nr:histone-fold-containing protein [Lentithecium fluviatile CBS 122367]